ncbi:hypothetical protein ACVMB0_000377 [Bradyrhizobium sp. USDA 4451]
MWFAGNHFDVDGSYPENETRLSDISLSWMAHAAETFPDRKGRGGFGIKVHDRFLKLNADRLVPGTTSANSVTFDCKSGAVPLTASQGPCPPTRERGAALPARAKT